MNYATNRDDLADPSRAPLELRHPSPFGVVRGPMLHEVQRMKLLDIVRAAHASGDRFVVKLCMKALCEGPEAFSAAIGWLGASASAGLSRSRVRVPAAEKYVLLASDRLWSRDGGHGRWEAGEVAVSLPHDSKRHDVKLDFGAEMRSDDDRKLPWFSGRNEVRRVYYAQAEHVAPFDTWMLASELPN